MKKITFIIAFLMVILQGCDQNDNINIPDGDANFLLSSVYGSFSHSFHYKGNKISKISYVLEEMSIKKEIIYNQDDQIEYYINRYEFDDLSVSVDTTFVEYQEKLIHRTTTLKYIHNLRINEYFQYDEQHRLINVRQETIGNPARNRIYKFSYDQANNVTRLDTNSQYNLFEYDDKINPYTQIDLDIKIILGEWSVMNVLSKNNTITKRIGSSIGTSNAYVYEYNEASLPINRKDKFDITTFYVY